MGANAVTKYGPVLMVYPVPMRTDRATLDWIKVSSFIIFVFNFYFVHTSPENIYIIYFQKNQNPGY